MLQAGGGMFLNTVWNVYKCVLFTHYSNYVEAITFLTDNE